MKLYLFDGVDARLELVPLAARRALDTIGAKLSLQGFLSLSLKDRSELSESGSGSVVDEVRARVCLKSAEPVAEKMSPLQEPDGDRVPEEVRAAFAEFGALSDNVWAALTPLDRYVLSKVAQKNRPERLAAAYKEVVGQSEWSTHLSPSGGVRMVSISAKAETLRQAKAECWVHMSVSAFEKLHSNNTPKGDVLGTARLAGIMATKRTSDLIPLCHPLALEHVDISFEEDKENSAIRVLCSVSVRARTGVEMEAMVGAQLASLTIYDMLKSVDRGMRLSQGRLLEKSGGRSGSFKAEDGQ